MEKKNYFENEVQEIDWMMSHWMVGETIEEIVQWYLDNGYSQEALDQYYKEAREYEEKLQETWAYWDAFCDRFGIIEEKQNGELPF